MAGTNPTRPGYVHKPLAAGGARVNALSSRSMSPPPDNDDSPTHEICLQPHRNNNNSAPTFALLDSGSSVHTVPNKNLLTSFQHSTGSLLTAANGSSISTLGHGSYSLNNNITIHAVHLSPSIPSPIISVSSLTHDHKKIVVFSDPISCVSQFLEIDKNDPSHLTTTFCG